MTLAWHFICSNRRLRFYPHLDKTAIVAPGYTWYDDPKKLRMCERGLHACRNLIDAMYYAPGPILCRVRLSGKIIEYTDKMVASERTVIWMLDATTPLRHYGTWCLGNLSKYSKEELNQFYHAAAISRRDYSIRLVAWMDAHVKIPKSRRNKKLTDLITRARSHCETSLP